MRSAKHNVVLGMPGYGKQTASAGRGFWRACRDMSGVWNYYQNGSLLASNFNQLWCLALNLAEAGEQVDYFAMLHDDIGPEDYWLDKAIELLESNCLDVLGVVSPIKDSRGMTSMALHRDGDDWMPLARLSMHDVYELPETFTSEDIGHPLLLNTGCWVAKWNQEWCRTVHFQVQDRIAFNRSSNRYQAQTIPEDWDFSRQLHEIGTGPTSHVKPLRIGATRGIALQHEGDTIFVNTHAWGRDRFDAELCKISPVPDAFPGDVVGWLLPGEAKALSELARDKRVLEIGSYCGLSTICLARTAAHVTAVDYFDGRATLVRPSNTLPQFTANTQRYGVAHKIITCQPDCPLPLDEYDLVFIDGDHSREAVSRDIVRACNVLAPNGLIAFHDYHSANDADVTIAVDDFVRGGAEILSIHDTIAVVRPPATIPLEV